MPEHWLAKLAIITFLLFLLYLYWPGAHERRVQRRKELREKHAAEMAEIDAFRQSMTPDQTERLKARFDKEGMSHDVYLAFVREEAQKK
jgi:hypothetical protein